MPAFSVFKAGTSYAVAVPATGNVVQALSAGCRYVRISAASVPCLVGFGSQAPGMLVGAAYYPDYFDVDGYGTPPQVTVKSSTGTAGTLYITEMSN